MRVRGLVHAVVPEWRAEERDEDDGGSRKIELPEEAIGCDERQEEGQSGGDRDARIPECVVSLIPERQSGKATEDVERGIPEPNASLIRDCHDIAADEAPREVVVDDAISANRERRERRDEDEVGAERDQNPSAEPLGDRSATSRHCTNDGSSVGHVDPRLAASSSVSTWRTRIDG